MRGPEKPILRFLRQDQLREAHMGSSASQGWRTKPMDLLQQPVRFLSSEGAMANAVAHQVYMGIGSNIGNKKENFLEALSRLAKLPDTKIIKESSLYESEPLGDSKDWYVNGAIEIETKFKPDMLLKKFKNIERAMGRKKVKKRWGARIIDLDILLYDAIVIKKKNLRIPHPEMSNRKFVLVPLSEIAPQVIHPELGVTVSELLVSVKDDKKVHLYHA
jgi:2-amino-4-hydroxy-6-hydroxymethyldihydropteridine diphosphokinase